MASLREPEEVKTRRTSTKGEPMSWQVRQSRGLSNAPEVRQKLKLEQKKLELQQQNKELDRQLKVQGQREKSALAAQKAWQTERAKEEATWQKWSADLKKTQEKENLQAFQNFLIQNYATQDDKGRVVLPLEVQKRAAGYAGMARTDGEGAIKKFKEDFVSEQGVKQQYQKLLPQIIKDREKALGKSLEPQEIEALSQLNPKDMAQVVKGWEQKQTATKARQEAETAVASQELERPQRRADILGGKTRYTGEQFRGKGALGDLPVRNDLSFNQATEAYEDVVDRAVSTMGGGGLATAAGAYMKYMPGARDLIDPNTPVRYGLRKAGEFVTGPVADAARGTIENIKKGEGVHPTGIDVLPGGGVDEEVTRQAEAGAKAVGQFGQNVGSAIVGTAQNIATGTGAHPTGVDVLPGGGAGELPEPVKRGAEAIGRTVKSGLDFMGQNAHPTGVDVLPSAEPETQKSNLFSGLADTVRNLFTASPEEMERRQNIWKTMGAEAKQTEAPVVAPTGSQAPAFPAPEGHVRKAEPITDPFDPRIPKPEEDTAPFPKAM